MNLWNLVTFGQLKGKRTQILVIAYGLLKIAAQFVPIAPAIFTGIEILGAGTLADKLTPPKNP